MSEGDEGLRLNRLQRFKKVSESVALEVHSHCEVPAGCGGVVLRWRPIDAPAGLTAIFYAPEGVREITLDGEPFDARRKQVLPGPHVIAFECQTREPEKGLLLGELELSPRVASAQSPRLSTNDLRAFTASTRAPADARWRERDFDAAAFAPLVALEVPAPPRNAPERWRHEMLARTCRGLGLAKSAAKPRSTTTAYVRLRFSLTTRGLEA